MQKSRLWMFAFIATIVLAATAIAQDKKPASPPAQTKLTFTDGKTVTIDYSAPSMRGRKIFGGLVPYDEVWRTGANAATSLKTDVDLVIGGETVPKGEYTLYTQPGMSNWKLIINKQTGQWGTEYSQGQDLVRVNMKVTPAFVGPGDVHHLVRQDQRHLGHAETGMGEHHRQRRREREEIGPSPQRHGDTEESLLEAGWMFPGTKPSLALCLSGDYGS